MKVRLAGADLCSYIVSSESDSGKEYEVDICLHPIAPDEDGDMQFNGACVCTRTENEWKEFGCEDWRYRCEPRLKKLKPGEVKFFQCKHLEAANKYALKVIKPQIAKGRQNLLDHQQP